jgi:2,4-dienoyl-CoA reductase-like NADH-dependent reductase (Old Yellow Enzyme family)
LIITEANFVEPTNWAFFPGLYTSEQALAWAPVVDVVHQKGGIFFAQLWHVGRASSPSLNGGAPPVSASAVEEVGINTHSNEPFGVPRALELSEIQEMIQKFAASAKLAKDAGFDGIEVSPQDLQRLDDKRQCRADRAVKGLGW